MCPASSDNQDWSGVLAILPTPLDQGLEVDAAGVRSLCKFCADQGLDGAIVLGSNGEAPYLQFEEKRRVMAAAVSGAAGRVPVIAGVSAAGTEEAVDLAQAAADAGCSAVMAALPLYFQLDLPKVIRHFEALAGAGGLPVFFYHFPEVTGLALTPRELASLAEIDGVIGAKLTIVNRPYLQAAIKATRRLGWKVFVGTSFLLKDCLDFGGAGVFCPLPLLGPADVKGIYSAFQAGEMSRANQLQIKVRSALPLFTEKEVSPALMSLAFQILTRLPYRPGRRSSANHALLKEALRLQGHPLTNRVKPPFHEVTEAQSQLVLRTLKAAGWIRTD